MVNALAHLEEVVGTLPNKRRRRRHGFPPPIHCFDDLQAPVAHLNVQGDGGTCEAPVSLQKLLAVTAWLRLQCLRGPDETDLREHLDDGRGEALVVLDLTVVGLGPH